MITHSGCFGETVSVRLEGHPITIFNGIPKIQGWGEDLVYELTPPSIDTRTMGALGGIPLIDIWNKKGGIAIFNTSTYQESITLTLKSDHQGVTIEASGGTHLEIFRHGGDYFDAVREFALRMKKKGLSVQPAPDWAFNANWETYGFEEDFDRGIITSMLPILKELNIKTVTIDAGWYGKNRGDDIDFLTGDFDINPDVIGSKENWVNLIEDLHKQGFRVRIWWTPGVAEKGTDLWKKHPQWFSRDVISSSSDTEDLYLYPGIRQVQDWNKALVKRFVGYGVDGFKQDDVYHYIGNRQQDQIDYARLINFNLSIAQSLKKDFTINTCNCGLAQNFYLMPGQNQLITSDPVGAKQFRRRAKYLHALNVNGAAILGDHIELTDGDVGPEEMDVPGFYDSVDFSSVVPLGLVLQTKFRQHPGKHYKKWFQIYRDYKFYNMKWVNVPLRNDQLETYLLQDNNKLYYSFFTRNSNRVFEGIVDLIHLVPKLRYKVSDIVNGKILKTFIAADSSMQLKVSFIHSLTISVLPQ
jgi:alpha-galactosidase